MGEAIESKILYRSPNLGDIHLYAPDLRSPFSRELGGIAAPGMFAFEVLDEFQQKLSLIGASHLFIHMARPAQVLFNFWADGSFRSMETRLGEGNFTDEVQIFGEQVIFKFGKSARTVYRGNNDYSFSIDTSIELRVFLGSSNGRVRSVQYNSDPFLPRVRHLTRPQIKRFPNRFFGQVIELELPFFSPERIGVDTLLRSSILGHGIYEESAKLGLSKIDLWLENDMLTLNLKSISNPDSYNIVVPTRLGRALLEGLPRLNVARPQQLNPAKVGVHAEELYHSVKPFLPELDGPDGLEFGAPTVGNS